MSEPIISIQDVGKTFRSQSGEVVTALEGVSFDVVEHDFVSIIGPSGCGKSTLLRIVSGLEDKTSGAIEFGDGSSRDNLGFVFQDSVLLPWRTVYENVSFPLEIKGDPDGSGARRVERLLDIVGLSDFRDSLPKELSGGMRQRASIARSLSYDPDILMMDEPFGALDALTRDALNVELRRIWDETSKTILFVTHDIEEAVFLSTKVVALTARPGTVRDVVSIDLPDRRGLDVRSDELFREYASRLRGMLES